MSLNKGQKGKRDKVRARKAMKLNPGDLERMLRQAFHADGTRKAGGIKKVVELMDRHKSWSGTSLLKQLVGQGYLRPEGSDYRITKKGVKLIAAPEAEAGA